MSSELQLRPTAMTQKQGREKIRKNKGGEKKKNWIIYTPGTPFNKKAMKTLRSTFALEVR